MGSQLLRKFLFVFGIGMCLIPIWNSTFPSGQDKARFKELKTGILVLVVDSHAI